MREFYERAYDSGWCDWSTIVVVYGSVFRHPADEGRRRKGGGVPRVGQAAQIGGSKSGSTVTYMFIDILLFGWRRVRRTRTLSFELSTL